jgi:hypothetical protein
MQPTGLVCPSAARAVPGSAVPQKPVLHLDVSFYSAALGRALSVAACTAFERSRSTTATAVSGRAFLQQPVLHLDVFVNFGLCLLWTYMSTAVFASPGRICLQQSVLHLDVYVYCSLCCTWTYLSTAVCAAP